MYARSTCGEPHMKLHLSLTLSLFLSLFLSLSLSLSLLVLMAISLDAVLVALGHWKKKRSGWENNTISVLAIHT